VVLCFYQRAIVQPESKMAMDMDRDFFMTPTEAMQYGIIDEIIKTKTSHIQMPAMPALFDRVVKL